MRTAPVIVLVLALLAFGCSKDKFETKPRLEIKDYNTKILSSGQSLTISMDYFDKEGDVDKGVLYSKKVRLNTFPPVPESDFLIDSIHTELPEFSKHTSGEITFQLSHADMHESQVNNDTIQWRFALIDRAGNSSDTILTDPIVIIKP